MYQLLYGLRVVEAAAFVAGPTGGLYLAQMGADVIRIDQIGGGPDYKRWPRTGPTSSRRASWAGPMASRRWITR